MFSDCTTEEVPCDGRLLTSDTAVSELTECTTSEFNTVTSSTNTFTTCEDNSLLESNELRTIFGLYHSDTPTPMKHLVTPDTIDRELPKFHATGTSGHPGLCSGTLFGRFRSQSTTSPMDAHYTVLCPTPRRILFESFPVSRENFLYGGAEPGVKAKATAGKSVRLCAASDVPFSLDINPPVQTHYSRRSQNRCLLPRDQQRSQQAANTACHGPGTEFSVAPGRRRQEPTL